MNKKIAMFAFNGETLCFVHALLNSAKEQNLPFCSEMKGHPSISCYIENGYRVLAF